MIKPKIAVMMDENTDGGGQNYETSKNYFMAISESGGIPYGIPYVADFVELASQEFDGFLSVGGGVQFPADWYVDENRSPYPYSERVEIERQIMRRFLDADKPVLGICHGMQMLAAIHGGKLSGNIPGATHEDANHIVNIATGTTLDHILVDKSAVTNSTHCEAVASVPSNVIVAARAVDGVIEAIEIPGKKFAVGIQWHQEGLFQSGHPWNTIYSAFVNSCKK